jgi:hypothetical protein
MPGQAECARKRSQSIGVVVYQKKIGFSRHGIFAMRGFNRWPPLFLELPELLARVDPLPS